MSWEYIRAKLNTETKEFYTLMELIELYNKTNHTNFILFGEDGISLPYAGRINVKTMDGMCGVLIIFNIMVAFDSFAPWQALIKFLAVSGNYTKIMVSHVNPNMINTWYTLGYKSISSFRNKRTHNDVQILVCDV